MEEELLRLSQNEEEILDVLKEITESKRVVLAWQTTKKERITHDCIIQSLDGHNKQFSFRHKQKGEELKFIKEDPVFFREEGQKLLFKTKVSPVSAKMVEASLPQQIKLKERREHKRSEESGQVMISCYSALSQGRSEFEFELFDYSSVGCAIKVRAQAVKHFKEGMELTIHNLADQELSAEVTGTIVYLMSFEKSQRLHQSKFHRMGIAFQQGT